MDFNSILHLMGMFGNTGGQSPQFGGGSMGNPPGVLSLAQPALTPLPTIPATNGTTAQPAPVPVPTVPQVQPHKGGFSTGNILTALLGSNFGQK